MPTSPIVSASSLGKMLVENEPLVLLDARKDRESYDHGHPVGARHVDVDEHLSNAVKNAARGGRHPLPSLETWCRTVGDWGINPTTRVVVYDGQSGANAAARTWWMLRSIGHERVAVLDGGLPAAVAAGMLLTNAATTWSAQSSYPGCDWLRPTVDIDRVDALRRDSSWRVVDVRSASRFKGWEEPIDPVAGHIAGAVNLPFAMNLRAGVYKSADELRAMYEKHLGAVRPDHLVVHCGSGVTGCHTLLGLEIAGMHGASLYVGGWSEWCRNGRPRATS